MPSFIVSSLLLPSMPYIRTYMYVGEEIAFYFGWMDFYSSCILVPLLLGLIMYLVRGKGTTVDTDPYLPLFSVFMAIWAVLFLVVRIVMNAHYYYSYRYCQ